MDLNEIKALMDRFDTSACTVLELEEGNLRLRLERGPPPFRLPRKSRPPRRPLERLRPSPLRRRRGRP